MKFKNALLKHKKIILAGIISIFVGMGLGFLGAPTQESYDEYTLKNNQAIEKLDVINTNLTNKKCDFEELSAKKTDLEQEQNKLIESERLVKESKEKKAKEEADRLAKVESEKKAQEESQKLAKVEGEKRIQQEEGRNTQEQNNGAKERNNVRSSNVNSNEKRNYNNVEEPNVDMVWQTKSGKKYHSTNHCGKTDFSKAVRISIQQAKSTGLKPCSKCY